MTVKGVLLRFFVIYAVLLITAGVIMKYFSIKAAFGVDFGILFGSVGWVCFAFGKKNSRCFTNSEKIAVIIGCVLIDLLVQAVPTLAALSKLSSDAINPAFFLIGLTILSHAFVIFWSVSSQKRWLLKKGIISS